MWIDFNRKRKETKSSEVMTRHGSALGWLTWQSGGKARSSQLRHWSLLADFDGRVVVDSTVLVWVLGGRVALAQCDDFVDEEDDEEEAGDNDGDSDCHGEGVARPCRRTICNQPWSAFTNEHIPQIYGFFFELTDSAGTIFEDVRRVLERFTLYILRRGTPEKIDGIVSWWNVNTTTDKQMLAYLPQAEAQATYCARHNHRLPTCLSQEQVRCHVVTHLRWSLFCG